MCQFVIDIVCKFHVKNLTARINIHRYIKHILYNNEIYKYHIINSFKLTITKNTFLSSIITCTCIWKLLFSMEAFFIYICWIRMLISHFTIRVSKFCCIENNSTFFFTFWCCTGSHFTFCHCVIEYKSLNDLHYEINTNAMKTISLLLICSVFRDFLAINKPEQS